MKQFKKWTRRDWIELAVLSLVVGCFCALWINPLTRLMGDGMLVRMIPIWFGMLTGNMWRRYRNL